MAEIHSTVEQAYRAIWGDVAEAQALVQLSRTSQDDASLCHLALPILERFLGSWERLDHELSRHGYPSLADRGHGS